MDNNGLPHPSVESVIGPSEALVTPVEDVKGSRAMELPGAVSPPTDPAATPDDAAPAAPAIAPASPPPSDPTTAQPLNISPDSPALAEDNDLIEPEWVDKAKAIVERTHDDPHMQNKEMNKFKADYLMKRYKKQIKVAEE